MDAKVKSHRSRASAASLGLSADHLHDRFLQLLQAQELHGTVLDFGSGRGHLSRRLAAAGGFSSITGVDLMPRPDDLPGEILWLQNDLNEPDVAAPESYDVIIASEVIEHLENPRLQARAWFRLLKPGGVLLLSTPNNESMRAIIALVFRGHFVEFGESSYPAHITALVRQDLRHILMEAGFNCPEFFFSERGALPFWTNLTWQKIFFGLPSGLRFSDNVFALAKKANGATSLD